MSAYDEISRTFRRSAADNLAAARRVGSGGGGGAAPNPRYSLAAPASAAVGMEGEEYGANDFRQYTDDADARERAMTTLRRIESALEQPNLTPEERDELLAMRSELAAGILPGTPGTLGRIASSGPIGWALGELIKPLQAVQLGVSDWLFDASSVFGSDVPNTPEINRSDYGSVFTEDYERLAERLAPSGLVGEDGHPSTSAILSQAGWHPDGGALNRIARGIASVTGDVVLDPVTWVSFGAAAMGAAARTAAAETAMRTTARDVIERELADVGLDAAGRASAAAGRAVSYADGPFAPTFTESLRRALPQASDDVFEKVMAASPRMTELTSLRDAGMMSIDDFTRAATQELETQASRRIVMERAAEIAERELAPVTYLPIAARDFAKVDPTFAAMRRFRRPGVEGVTLRTKKALPGYAIGGVRIGSMFGGRGFTIPGTIGLGRKITSRTTIPLSNALKRVFPAYARLAREGTDLLMKTNSDYLLKRLLSEEGAGWLEARRYLQQIDAPYHAHNRILAGRTGDLMEAIDGTTDTIDTIMPKIFNMMEQGGARLTPDVARSIPEIGRIGDNDVVHEAAMAWAAAADEADTFVWEQLNKHTKLGKIADWMFHSTSHDGHRLSEILAKSGVIIRGAKGDVGTQLVESQVAAFGRKTAAGAAADVAAMHARTSGVASISMLPTHISDNLMMMPRDMPIGDILKGASQTTFGRAEELNKLMREGLAQIARENPGLIPARYLKADFDFYETNAAKVHDIYLSSMQEAARVYEATSAYEKLSALRRHGLDDGIDVDVNATVRSALVGWWDKELRNGASPHELAVEIVRSGEAGAAQALDLGPIKTVRVGAEKIDAPAVLAHHPDFIRTTNNVKLLFSDARRNGARYARERNVFRRELENKGISREVAAMVASGVTEPILKEARSIRRMTRETERLLDSAVTETVAMRGARIDALGQTTIADNLNRRLVQIEETSQQAHDDLLTQYAAILDEYIDPEDVVEVVVRVMNEEDLVLLERRISAAVLAEHEDDILSLQRQVATLQDNAAAEGIALYDDMGLLTQAGARIATLEAELKMTIALTNPDRNAVRDIMSEAFQRIDGLYARRAAEDILADIEMSGVLALDAQGNVIWRGMEGVEHIDEAGNVIGTVDRLTPTEVAAEIQAAYDSIDDLGFASPFFSHPAVREAEYRASQRGASAVSTTEIAELEAEGLSLAALEQAGLSSEAFMRSLGAQKEEYLERLAATEGLAGRKPLFSPAEGETGIVGQRLVEDQATLQLRWRDDVTRTTVSPRQIAIWRDLADTLKRPLRERYLADANQFLGEQLEHAVPLASPFTAIRRGEWRAVGSHLRRVPPEQWDVYNRYLWDAGMDPKVELRPLYDTKTGRDTIQMVRTQTSDAVATTAAGFDALIAARRVELDTATPSASATTAVMADPDAVAILDSAIAVEDALTVYRAAADEVRAGTPQAKREMGRLQTQLAEFEEAAAEASEALATSLRGTTAKGSSTLRNLLYASDTKGRWRLTVTGRRLKALLPDDEWMRMHNNAEYLMVFGELEQTHASTSIRRAVRHSKEFQDSQAGMFSATRAAQTVKDTRDRIDAMLVGEHAGKITNSQESVDMMRELVHKVDNLRRFQPSGKQIPRGYGDAVFGRDVPELATELGSIRDLLDELKGRHVLMEGPNGPRTVEIKGSWLDSSAKELQPQLTASSMKPAFPGERMVNMRAKGLDSGALAGTSAHPALAQFFENWIDVTRNLWSPTGLTELREGTRKAIKYWRMTNTVGRPITFNMRNAITIVWANQLGGVRPGDPLYFLLAAPTRKFRTVLNNGGTIEQALDVVPRRYRAAYKAAEEQDAVLNSYAATNVRNIMRGIEPISTTKGKLQAANLLGRGAIHFRAGAYLMETFEDLGRMVLFVKHFDEAIVGSAEQAAEIVTRIHFNYAALSNMERKIQDVVPFYIWAKRNFELQLAVMIERPEMISRYWKLQRAIEDNFGSKDGDTPYDGFAAPGTWGPYASPTGMILREDTPYWARIFLDINVSTNDLLNSPFAIEGGISFSGFSAWAGNMLGPQFDVLGQIVGPDDGYPAVAPVGLTQAWQIVAALSPFWGDSTNPQGVTEIPHFWAEQFDTLFPWVRQFVEPLMIPEDSRRAQRMGFAPGDTGLDARLRALALEQAKGAGVRIQTPVEQRGASYEAEARVKEILHQLALRGQHRTPEEARLEALVGSSFGG